MGPVREQRKVVTALFADVVGSTGLAESFDPEDLMELVGGALSQMVGCVERFGGTVKDLAGDGLLALFGAPVAHEDDPERAVRAGLDIVDTIRAYASGSPLLRGKERLAVRIGIDSGMVAVGPVGGGGHVELGAMGDAVNTAARLQAEAEPGTVLVGSGTFERVQNLFEWSGPRRLSLKGKAEAVRAYRAVRPLPVPAIAPRQTGAEVPLLGRDAEVETIRSAASRLLAGQGGLVFVTGEPGIGKSRMLAELRRWLQDNGGATPSVRVQWLEGRCRSFQEAIPYSPFRDMFGRWLERAAAEAPQSSRRSVLEARLGQWSEVGPALDTLTSIALTADEAEALRRLTPEEIQLRIREGVAVLLRGLAGDPLVVTIEDLHWADSSSLGLLEHLLPLARELPVLFAFSARNEQGRWAALRDIAARAIPDSCVVLPLAPLAAPALAEMLTALLGTRHVVDEIRQRLLATTGGNPFFLEELVRSLLDQGAIARMPDGVWNLDLSVAVDVPETVEQVLMSRIDSLGPHAYEALTAAAVVGAQFELAVLENIVEDRRVAEAVAELEHADLVRRDPDRPTEYRFKHALIQETAYRGLLRRRRRELHAATARALQEVLSEQVEEIADAVARHLMEAGDLAGAHYHARIAGDRSKARFANEEAIASYRLALDAGLALRQQATTDHATPLVDVASVAESLGEVLGLVGRHEDARDLFAIAATETPSAQTVDLARLERRTGDTLQVQYRNNEALVRYERATQLLEAVESAQRDDRWWEEWLNVGLERMAAYYWMGRVDEMAGIERQLRAIVEARATNEQILRHTLLAKDLRLRQNSYRIDDETLALAQTNLRAAEALADVRHIARAQLELGFCELFGGELDVAEVRLHESLAGAERLGDAVGRLRCLAYLSLLTRLQGREGATAEHSDRLVEVSEEAGVYIYLPLERANRAWLALRDGRAVVARRLAEKAIAEWSRGEIAFPFQWAARWVLVAAAAADKDWPATLGHVDAMFAVDQQPLPDRIVFELKDARTAMAAGDLTETQRHIEGALELAQERGYL